MDVDDRGLRQPAQRMRLQRRLHRRERIIEGPLHEDLAQRLHHQHLAPVRRRIQPRPAPRGRLGKVQRADQTRLAINEAEHVLLIKGVIAQRHAIRPRREQQPRMIRGQPRAGRGVFAIDHDEIKAPVRPQTGQPVADRRASRTAHDIAEEKEFHGTPDRPGQAKGQGGTARARPRRGSGGFTPPHPRGIFPRMRSGRRVQRAGLGLTGP